MNLENHETYGAFKRMLESVMTVVSNIQDARYGVKPEMPLVEFINRFNLDTGSRNLIVRSSRSNQLCLSHILHLYEILELTQIDFLLEYLTLERP